MSSLKKLIELTKAVTVASRPVMPNAFSGYAWPTVQVDPHYKSGFTCSVKWDQATYHIPQEIVNVAAMNKPASDGDVIVGAAVGFDAPEDAIDAMYERLVVAARAALDSMVPAHAKLAALVA